MIRSNAWNIEPAPRVLRLLIPILPAGSSIQAKPHGSRTAPKERSSSLVRRGDRQTIATTNGIESNRMRRQPWRKPDS